ncbi:hypothetical protein H6F68_00160 [Trichocoleus sp. FACHB-262]|nr:hypothetical protein [Trichocoleus sp. FACHB-262]
MAQKQTVVVACGERSPFKVRHRPFIMLEGTLGGGLRAATALNSFTKSLIAQPDCYCYLNRP